MSVHARCLQGDNSTDSSVISNISVYLSNICLGVSGHKVSHFTHDPEQENYQKLAHFKFLEQSMILPKTFSVLIWGDFLMLIFSVSQSLALRKRQGSIWNAI